MGRKSKSQGCLAVIDTFILHSQGILQASKNLDLNPPNVKYDSAGEYLVCKYYEFFRLQASLCFLRGSYPKGRNLARNFN